MCKCKIKMVKRIKCDVWEIAETLVNVKDVTSKVLNDFVFIDVSRNYKDSYTLFLFFCCFENKLLRKILNKNARLLVSTFK